MIKEIMFWSFRRKRCFPPNMDSSVDWRNGLQPSSREHIINKIMETLKRHLPFSDPEGLQELRRIAVRFEEKIYTAATSQADYLRKISLKMLTVETKSQNTIASTLPSNSVGNSKNPGESAEPQIMQSQGNNQLQSVPLPMAQANQRQQLLSQNISTVVMRKRCFPPNMDSSVDWRNGLQPSSRERIINKITEILKRNLPCSGPEGLRELRGVAVRFEEKIYSAATSQADYLQKISLKMLSMEKKHHNNIADTSSSNSGGNS